MTMASQINPPPTRDGLVQKTGVISDVWNKWATLLSDTVGRYLVSARNSSGRDFPLFYFPPLTTTQRDALQAVDDGVAIYNSTAQKFQGRAGGVWVDLN